MELDPSKIEAHVLLGRAYVQKSMFEEGIAEFEKALADLRGEFRCVIGPRICLWVEGRRADAQKMLDKLNERSRKSYSSPRYVGRIYVGLGEKDKAFEWLEKSYQDRSIAERVALKWTQS